MTLIATAIDAEGEEGEGAGISLVRAGEAELFARIQPYFKAEDGTYGLDLYVHLSLPLSISLSADAIIFSYQDRGVRSQLQLWGQHQTVFIYHDEMAPRPLV